MQFETVLTPEMIRSNYERKLWAGKTFHDFFREAVERVPEKIAITCGRQRFTFLEFYQKSERLAAGLHGLGIRKGDVVTVQIPNWPEMCFYTAALARIGAVIQPMHVVYRQREMRQMLQFCESRALVIPHHYQDFDFVAAVGDIRASLPSLEQVIVIGDLPPKGTVSHDILMDDVSPDQTAAVETYLSANPVDPNDIMYLNFTSGTEGDPKGFLHTHNTLLSVFAKTAQMMESYNKGQPPADVQLCHSPMSHSFGFLTTHQVIIRKITAVIMERYSPGEALRLIEQEKVTNMSGTPAHLIGLLGHPDLAKYDLSSLKNIGTGGAACPIQVIKELKEKLRCTVSNAYGMGENIVHTITMPFDAPEVVFETVGRPIPGTGVELKIYNADRTAEMPKGETGEIAFRGPSLFVGYFKRPDLTAATRTPDGWFFTGDMGFIDKAGCLHLAGRKKEMINRGGVKIFPLDIENLLHCHPKIERAAVLGMPDYRLGEKVCAYIVLRPGETVTSEEIIGFLNSQQIMKYKIPERIEIVSELPMTPTGKVLKRALEKDIAGKLVSEAGTTAPATA